MFSKKLTLYVTRKKVFVGKSGSPKAKLLELGWDGVDLDPVLAKIVKKYKPKSVNIILGESVVYLYAFLMDPKSVTKESVFREVQLMVPDPVSKVGLFWRVIGIKRKSKEKIVQVMVIPDNIISAVTHSARKYKIGIDKIVTAYEQIYSYSRKYKGVAIIATSGRDKFLVVTGPDGIYYTRHVGDDLSSAVRKAADTVSEKFGVSVSSAIGFSKAYHSTFKSLGLKAKTQEVGTLGVLGLGKDKDGEVFQIDLESFKTFDQHKKKEVEKEGRVKREKEGGSKLLYILLAILVAIVVAVFALQFTGIVDLMGYLRPEITSNEEIVVEEGESAVIVDLVQEEATESGEIAEAISVVDLSTYKVQVLNGSGIVGRAADVAEALTVGGFSGVETGNTTLQDGGGITLSAKESLPDGAFEGLKDALADTFGEIVNGEDLGEGDDFDFIIVIES